MKANLMRLRFFVVFAVLTVFILSVMNAAGTGAEHPTEIIIIGGLHGMHKQNPKYSPEILRDVIVKTKPAAILSELPATALGEPTIINQRINSKFVPDASDENWSANAAADILSIPVIGYDRTDRNEYFAKTKYFERMTALNKSIELWLHEMKNRALAPAEAAIMGTLADRAEKSQAYFCLHAGPEIVNSDGFDELIRLKHEMSDELITKLASRIASLKDMAGEFVFLRDQWNDRNRIMADNILAQARKFPGRRLIVICGVDHKYALHDLLVAKPELNVMEYYEVDAPAK